MDNHINIPMLISFFFFLLPQLSLSDYDYSICRDADHFYNCGHLSHISYPFWGHNRPFQCGAGTPFHLICNEKSVTTILISSQNFTVLEINTTAYTIKLKRTDFSLNLCSPQFNSNSLFSSPFQSVNNIIIFYNCTSSPILPAEDSLCGVPNRAFGHVAHSDYGYEHIEESMNCTGHITVPVGADFPIKKNIYGYFERDVVEKGLDKEFEVSYSVNGKCLDCSKNQGDCEWNDDIEKQLDSSCYYCPYGSIAYSADCSSYYKSSWNLKRKVIVGVVGCAVILALMMCITICYIRGKSSIQQVKFWFKTKNDKNIEAFFKEHGALTQKKYKFSEIKKMTNSFKIKLGQGGFGVVYKGNLFNGCPVAVKILNASKRNGEEFINEVASITRTSHVNVVTLLGFCFEGRKKALVYEFMSNGSLDKFIYNKGPENIGSLSWDNLHQVAKGIARGLEYLHRGCTTRILHFDIKPHNILLDEKFNPKISDFGLAKLCLRKESIISMSDQRGTMGYVAPEVWNRHFGGVSHKSDVYSYGMMLLEMVGGRKNINADASHTSEIYFPHWVYNRLEFESDLRSYGVMDTKEDEIARRMTIVGLWCIQTFPNDRPTMSKVVEMLEVSMNLLKIPPKPLLSSPTRSLSSESLMS